MCKICSEWELGKLTSSEALRNLGELIQTSENEEKDHYFEASERILDKEVPFYGADDELDKLWQEESED